MWYQLRAVLWACNYTRVFWWSTGMYCGTLIRYFAGVGHMRHSYWNRDMSVLLLFSGVLGKTSECWCGGSYYLCCNYLLAPRDESVSKKKKSPVLLWLNTRNGHFRDASGDCCRSFFLVYLFYLPCCAHTSSIETLCVCLRVGFTPNWKQRRQI